MKTGKAFRLSARFLNAVFTFSDNTEVCNARTTGQPEVIPSPKSGCGKPSPDRDGRNALVFTYRVTSGVVAYTEVIQKASNMHCSEYMQKLSSILRPCVTGYFQQWKEYNSEAKPMPIPDSQTLLLPVL